MSANSLDLKIHTLETMYALGWNPILIAANGTKKPIGKWELYQDHRRPLAELDAELRKKPKVGIAAITGCLFDADNKKKRGLHLVMLEFEQMADFETFLDAARNVGFGTLVERFEGYWEETPGGGVHLYFYVPLAVRNVVLAQHMNEDGTRGDVIAETRGYGGYSIMAPSGGSVHPSGKPYTASGELANVPTFTDDDWAQISYLVTATLDQRKQSRQQRRYDDRKRAKSERSYLRPGDDFNQRGNFRDILEPHGWHWIEEKGGVAYLGRPGGKNPTKHDATIDVVDGVELFSVFSTSVDTFETETPYSKFAVYALLNCGGDFKKAASELRFKGFGTLPAMTLYGIAELFADLYGDVVRYVPESGGWYVWDGRHWVFDTLGRVKEFMKATIRAYLALAVGETDDDKRKKHVQFALSCQTHAKTVDALKLAESMPEIAMAMAEFDTDPLLFNVANGTINLATGELQAHDPLDYITRVVEIEHDPDATAPQFKAFLSDALDTQTADYLESVIGYSLSALVTEKAYWLIYGETDTGKSTLTNVLLKLFGGYAVAPEERALAVSRNRDSDPADMIDFVGARVAIVSETRQGLIQNAALVKSLTGRNRQRARKFHHQSFEFDPTAKLIYESNWYPVVDSRDDAMFNRVKVIPFTKRIEKPIRNFDDILAAELPGILNIALDGFRRYQTAEKLVEPASVRDAVRIYQQEMNPVHGFVTERCDLEAMATVKKAVLYEAYGEWAEESGIRMPLKKADFYSFVGQLANVSSFYATNHVASFRGIALKPDAAKGPRLLVDNPFNGRKTGS